MSFRYIRFNTDRTYGIELEVNRKVSQARLAQIIMKTDKEHQVEVTQWAQSIENHYWHVKTDATCGDTGQRNDGGGFEIASYVAKGHKCLKTIAEVVEQLKLNNVQVNKYCGFHIHAGVNDFGMKDIAILAANWAKMETVIAQAIPVNRRDNIYCRFLSSIYKGSRQPFSVDKFWEKVSPKGFDREHKRTSLNFTNFLRCYNAHMGQRCTVELRLPEGTVEPQDVKNWIRCYIHFVSVSKDQKEPNSIAPTNVIETLTLMGLHSEEPFYVLSSGLFETKLWFLKRILTYATDAKIKAEAVVLLNEMIAPTVSESESFVRNVLGEALAVKYIGPKKIDDKVKKAAKAVKDCNGYVLKTGDTIMLQTFDAARIMQFGETGIIYYKRNDKAELEACYPTEVQFIRR